MLEDWSLPQHSTTPFIIVTLYTQYNYDKFMNNAA